MDSEVVCLIMYRIGKIDKMKIEKEIGLYDILRKNFLQSIIQECDSYISYIKQEMRPILFI